MGSTSRTQSLMKSVGRRVVLTVWQVLAVDGWVVARRWKVEEVAF